MKIYLPVLTVLIFATIVQSKAAKNLDSCLTSQPLMEVKDTVSLYPERTYIFGINYGSNTSFMGVKQDSVSQQYYIMPNFTYAAKSGFYVYAGGYYLPNKPTQNWDEIDLSAGYDFKVSKKAQGSISYMKSFFSETSPQVNSTLTNDLQLYFKRKIFTIKSKIVFDYYFGSDTDYSLSWINSRSFTWEEIFSKNDDITITPKIRIVAGSQNFYYAKNPKKHPDFGNKKKGKGGGTSGQNSTGNQATVYQFGVLSYIFSLPITYTINNFSLEGTVSHSIGGDLNPDRPAFTYYSFSIYYTL
jgi:hypothetical protein